MFWNKKDLHSKEYEKLLMKFSEVYGKLEILEASMDFLKTQYKSLRAKYNFIKVMEAEELNKPDDSDEDGDSTQSNSQEHSPPRNSLTGF